MQEHVSGWARLAVALFFLAVAGVTGIVAGNAGTGTAAAASAPVGQDVRNREAELITHGGYYSWLAQSECSTGDNARCSAALGEGNAALGLWGLTVMEDGSISPVG